MTGRGAGTIRALFDQARSSRKALFVAYVTAGDPDLESSAGVIEELARSGVDVIELGVPYSDPVADGPTNMKAADRALKSGVSLRKVLELAAGLRKRGIQTPFVLFTYYNPVFKFGQEEFARLAAGAGIDAVLTVDLPPEEADGFRAALKAAHLGTVFLASPTTGPDRLRKIDEASTEFVYYVSRLGVTGAQSALSSSLGDELERVRKSVKAPLAVGFGISTPEHARSVAALAEGVVVGSALVQLIEANPNPKEARAKIGKLAKSLALEVRRSHADSDER
jgi:tryptophan synthase alpha chain